MKSKKSYAVFVALLIFSIAGAQEELPKGVSTAWYAKTTAAIHQLEFNFRPAAEKQCFQVNNPVNHAGFYIQPKGYSVYNTNSNNNQRPWNIRFSINGIGRDNKVEDIDSYRFGISNTQASLTYQSPALDIQYINNERGLRQNFIINNRPSGNGKLSTHIQVESLLTATEMGENKIVFHTAGNVKDVKLIYNELKVWDAVHTVLPASMHFDASTNKITITVDDHNAVYPVTIDPLNTTADWTTSSDGILPALLNNLQLQVQTLYGYTVASLGDVNGDGFDDVAVSAPGMADVITGTGSLTGVGAVFIYLGSASGLASTPSKVLQPSTAVDGALFGFSVDAGDITGDGKNDIVIGAPMDRYMTDARATLGTDNVEVTAGKVYIYRSEDLFTTANPSPFLQLRLEGSSYFSTGILGLLNSNVNVKSLFGFSVSVANDLNGDNKADILVGVPSYLGIDILSAQVGAAFVYYSNNLNTSSPAELNPPSSSLLGVIGLPVANTSGLLFGYSIDAIGDYNSDGRPDVVVGAPAGIDLSSLGSVFSGQVLGGSAYVFYGNATGINSNSTVKLQASASGLLSNTANLFGYKVKGVVNAAGTRNGNILIGAPSGATLSNVVGGLKVKAGEIHLFKKKASPGTYTSDQILSSPRSSSILSILAGRTINVSLLFGSSMDNMLDVNCDNIGDIIVGEPLSSAVPMLGADVVGGAAYIYLGKSDGTYNTTPFWDLHAEVSDLLGINTTSLIGYSVAGARYTKGRSQGVRSLIGGPSNSLDFGVGLLNLGNTIGTIFDMTFDNNGIGKSYNYSYPSCSVTLPATLLEFKGKGVNKTVVLNWVSATEDNIDLYELQKSIDGSNFETIAIAFAKGSQHNDYGYTDSHPYMGMNYYRLKMVDKNKQFIYSNIVAVSFNEKLPGDIVIAPNPVQTDITIRINGIEKGLYRLELQNTAGQVVAARSIMVSQFSQTETMERNSAMSSGIYWLNIYDNTNRKVTSLPVLISK